MRVLAGQYSGDTGMVVRVEDALCYLISDTSREEIKVFARQVPTYCSTCCTSESHYAVLDLR